MNPYISALLEKDEGRVNHVYQDSRGYWTIGIGRMVDERKGGRLRDSEIDFMLANDIAEIESQAQGFHWYAGLNEVRQAVILSAIFQLGINSFRDFREMARYVEAGDYHNAAEQMRNSLWANQTPARVGRLAKMMETGAM